MSQINANPSQMGPTPIRRSTRLASANNSVAGSYVQQSVATTTATQSAAGARRKGPLSSVKSRESQAYGSTGRLGAAEQLAVPAAGFAQTLDAQRETAVTRDEEHGSDDASDVSSSHESLISDQGSPAFPASSRMHEQRGKLGLRVSRGVTPEDDDSSPSPSIVDTSKSFGMVHEAGMTARVARPNGASQINERAFIHPQQPARFTQFGARSALAKAPVRPSGINGSLRPRDSANIPHVPVNGLAPIFAQPQPEPERKEEGWKYLKRWKQSPLFLPMLALLGLLLALSLTYSSGLLGALVSKGTHTAGGVKDQVSSSSPVVDHHGLPIIDSRASESRFKELDSSIDSLKEILPPTIVVLRNKNGELKIPDEFWRALASKVQAERLGDLGSIEWVDFLEKNRQNAIEFFIEQARLPGPLRKSIQAIAQDVFLELVYGEYAKLKNNNNVYIDQKITEAIAIISIEAKTIAKDVATKAFLDQIRLESLAFANLLAHAEISLRKVNFFSTGHGARVDPFRTSPTSIDRTPIKTRFFRRLLSFPKRRPPVAALEKWDEPGDCWCAAPDDKGLGLAQLAVSLGQDMLPRQVTIEHIPKQALLDYRSAPKTIELWVESGEMDAMSHDCRPGPKDKGFVCLGSFDYNVHGNNHIQTFNLDTVVNKPVRKTLVRVLDNWGSNHTCIYRVRLHGEYPGKVE